MVETISGKGIDFLANEALRKIKNKGVTVSPRGFETKELLNVTLVNEKPNQCLLLGNSFSSKIKYISAEILWYLSGNRNPEFIKKYASFWGRITDDSGNINSNYGDLIFYQKNIHGFSQFQWAINTLINDPDSRQALIHFNNTSHQYQGNRDFPCTVYGLLFIRNNKLHFKISMRSNDLIFGFFNDLPFFNFLHNLFLAHLKPTYPELEIGNYIHHVDNLHIYSKHYYLINKILNQDSESIGFSQEIDDTILLGDELTIIKNWVDGKKEFPIKDIKNPFLNSLLNLLQE